MNNIFCFPPAKAGGNSDKFTISGTNQHGII